MDWLLQTALPAFEVATQLLQRGYESSQQPATLREDAERALRALSSTPEAADTGIDTQALADARLALAALLDELALRGRDPLAETWQHQGLLQQRFVHPTMTTAGDRFFERLQELLSAPRSAQNLQVLRIFAISLELGFAGRFAAHDEGPALTQLRLQVRRRLGSLIKAPAPPQPPALALVPRARWRLPQAIGAVATLALMIALVAVLTRESRLGAALRDTRSLVEAHHQRLLEEAR